MGDRRYAGRRDGHLRQTRALVLQYWSSGGLCHSINSGTVPIYSALPMQSGDIRPRVLGRSVIFLSRISWQYLWTQIGKVAKSSGSSFPTDQGQEGAFEFVVEPWVKSLVCVASFHRGPCSRFDWATPSFHAGQCHLHPREQRPPFSSHNTVFCTFVSSLGLS